MIDSSVRRLQLNITISISFSVGVGLLAGAFFHCLFVKRFELGVFVTGLYLFLSDPPPPLEWKEALGMSMSRFQKSWFRYQLFCLHTSGSCIGCVLGAVELS